MKVALSDYLSERMAQDNEAGRILRLQYSYDVRETKVRDDEMDDPTHDETHSPVRGIVHRYADRLLLLPLYVCSVYCRFCFRRAVVGRSGILKQDELDKALAYIAGRTEVREVILSGGDPLILAPRQLAYILDALDKMTHIEIIRIHSRLPVSDPMRLEDALLDVLSKLSKALYVVIHINHSCELEDERAQEACARLLKSGCVLLGQSVLLRDVNDNEKALEQLWRAMVRHRIKPYYLHHLDRARGTSHFRVSVARGRALMNSLRHLSGLLRPDYVIETPNGAGKIPLTNSWAHEIAKGCYHLRSSIAGQDFFYFDEFSNSSKSDFKKF